MSSKVKKDLAKCKEHATKIEKILETNKAIVDADFLVTIKSVIERIDNELQPSNVKGIIEDTGKNPVDDLVKVLGDYDVFLTKIHAEQKLKRYMQSTRVRRNLDQLNTALYGLVRGMSAKVEQLNSSKKKKDKDVKPKKKRNYTTVLEDIDGRKLWEEYFEDEGVMVEWNKFTAALARKIDIDEEGLLSLRYVLDNSGTGEVTLLKFNEFLKAFGPFKDSIQNLRNVVNNRWFHGFLTSEEAERLLELQQIGTYLIRFSRSQMGSFALAFVDGTRRINHTLIHFCPPNGYSINENDAQGESNRVFNNLESLIRHYNYILKNPFNSTITRESWFHGDVNNDEAADLLKSKPEGTFLFRFSSRKGYLTVSFIADGQLQHTLIQPTANGYICNGRSHGTLQEVVDANSDKFKLPLETLTFITVPKYENRVDNQRVQTPTTYISIPMSSPGSTRNATQSQTSPGTPDSTNYADLPSSNSVDDLEKSTSKDKKKLKHSSSKDKKEKKNKDKTDKKRSSSMSKRSSKAHITQPINSSGSSSRRDSGSSATTPSYIDVSANGLQQTTDTPVTSYTNGNGEGYVDAKDLRKPPVNFNNVNANNVEYNLGVPQDLQGEMNPYDVIPLNTPVRDGYRRENSQNNNQTVSSPIVNGTNVTTPSPQKDEDPGTRYSNLEPTSPVANITKRMSEARINPSQYGVLPVTDGSAPPAMPNIDSGVDVESESESDEPVTNNMTNATNTTSRGPSQYGVLPMTDSGNLTVSGGSSDSGFTQSGSLTQSGNLTSSVNGTNRTQRGPAQYGVLPMGESSGNLTVSGSSDNNLTQSGNMTNANRTNKTQAPSQYGVLPTGDSGANLTVGGTPATSSDNLTQSGSNLNTTNRTKPHTPSQYGVLPTGDSGSNLTVSGGGLDNRTNSGLYTNNTLTNNSTNTLNRTNTLGRGPAQYGVLPTGDSAPSINATSGNNLSNMTSSGNNATNTNTTNRAQTPSQYGVLPTGDSGSNMTVSGGLDNRTNSGLTNNTLTNNTTNRTNTTHTPSQYGVLPPTDPNVVSPRRKDSDSSAGSRTPRSGSTGASGTPRSGSIGASGSPMLGSSTNRTNTTNSPSQYGVLPPTTPRDESPLRRMSSNVTNSPGVNTNKTHTPSQYGVLPEQGSNNLSNKTDSSSNSGTPRTAMSPNPSLTNRTNATHTPSQYGVLPPSDSTSADNSTNKPLGNLTNTSNRPTGSTNYASVPPSGSSNNMTNNTQSGYIDTALLSRPASNMTNGTNKPVGNLTNTSNRAVVQSNYATLPPSITTSNTTNSSNNGNYIDTRNLSNKTSTPPTSMNMTAPGNRTTTTLVAEDKLTRRNSDNLGNVSPLGFSTERAGSGGAYVNTSVLSRPVSQGPSSNGGGSYIDTKSLSDRSPSPAPNGPGSQNSSYVDLANLSRGSRGSGSPASSPHTSNANNASYVDTNNLSNKNSSYVDTSAVGRNGSYVDTGSIKGNASGAQPGYVDTTKLKDSKDKKDKDKKKEKSKHK
eukprot:TRINITY_DN1257_c0_g1_i1.p1 TRINITY_DN1257_c0_g1~~TRINITY_DN1257_c0_g1_i1.p1  ORF type:complete len:1506 (+),score=435.23 TRINITY_DN1257_c0_g1_i1:22-4518(+)